jgi:hypothetical protein
MLMEWYDGSFHFLKVFFFVYMGMISMFKFQFTTERSVTKDYMLGIATQ